MSGMAELRFDAVLFDFDGVLVDSEPVHFRCWADILARYRVALDWETYNRVGRGYSEEEMVRAFCALREPPIAVEELWSEYPRKQRMFLERALGLITPEVRDLVSDLHQDGIALAVVTSSARSEVEPILKAGGVLSQLRAFVVREDVTNPKPAPEPYQKAALRIGAKHPLVVEDSDVGAASGIAAGFEVLRIQEPMEMPAAVRRHLSI
jgi:beta-phosphoglucomutase